MLANRRIRAHNQVVTLSDWFLFLLALAAAFVGFNADCKKARRGWNS